MSDIKALTVERRLHLKDDFAVRDTVLAMHTAHRLLVTELERLQALRRDVRTVNYRHEHDTVLHCSALVAEQIKSALRPLVWRAMRHKDWHYAGDFTSLTKLVHGTLALDVSPPQLDGSGHFVVLVVDETKVARNFGLTSVIVNW